MVFKTAKPINNFIATELEKIDYISFSEMLHLLGSFWRLNLNHKVNI